MTLQRTGVAVAERTYDALMPQMSTNGRFDSEALNTLSASFVDLKTLEPPVDMWKLYTNRFLPKV